PAAMQLRISAVGAVNVEGVQQSGLAYHVTHKVRAVSEAEAQRLLDGARMTVRRQGGAVTMRINKPACWNCGFQSVLSVKAPYATRDAVISTTGGEIQVANIEGRINVDSSAGAIRADNIGGGVRANTAGGPITLGAIGGPVRCDTAG